MKKVLPYIIIAAVAIGAGTAGAWFYKVSKPAIALTTKAGAPGAQPPRVLGPNNPRVTIEEFGDFQCPPCGKLHPILKEVETKYGNSVALVFRELPMSRFHANALEA